MQEPFEIINAFYKTMWDLRTTICCLVKFKIVKTFDSWFVRFVDFDTIGEKYALAYIYDSEGNGKPHRIDITSSKNILID